jgi:transcriptional regulator with XRE-family HTH domain/tetratricopeptide (TPR) repeat protein
VLESVKQSLPNELLSYARQRRGWSQNDLAELLNKMAPREWERGLKDVPSDKRHYKRLTTAKTIKRWEQGISTPFPYYLRRLESLFKRTAQELGYPEKGIPYWNVPYRPNKFFMGREDILSELHSVIDLRNQQYTPDDKVSSKKSDPITLQPQALVGLGGIGKSQIAREYAYRYAFEYQTVIWLDASSQGVLEQDFTKLASFLNLKEKNEEDLSIRIDAVKEWLMHFTRWLLVFDGANELYIIRDFLPPECFGHTIITTQSSATGDLAKSIKVHIMPDDISAVFILRRSKVIGLDDRVIPEDKYLSALQIARLIRGLPLMLAQASAFIERNPGSLEQYPMLFLAQPQKHLHFRDILEEYPYPVTKTLDLNFKAVAAVSQVAVDLLQLIAFLDPGAIPTELISETASQLGPVLSPLLGDLEALRWAMMDLSNYSLVEQSAEEDSYIIHPIVQLVIQDMMEVEERREWAQRAVTAVDQAFPGIEATSGTIPYLQDALWRSQRYLPHALMCAKHIRDYDISSKEAESLLHKTASYFFLQGKFVQAEFLFRQLVTFMERSGGNNKSVRLVNLLVAQCCVLQAKYDEAEILCKKVLAELTIHQEASILPMIYPLTEQASGDNQYTISDIPENEVAYYPYADWDNLDRLTGMSCLACLGEILSKQTRFAELEKVLKQATVIMQGVTDADSPNLLFFMASLYIAQGENKKVEAALKELITVGQGWFKSDLGSMLLNFGLAATYVAQKKNYVDAEMHMRNARFVFLQTMPEHPFLEYIYKGLIDVYQEQGKFADLAETLLDLSNFYNSQGRYDKVMQLSIEIVNSEQLKKEQPWIVADRYLYIGLNNLQTIQHMLPTLDSAKALEVFEATEEALNQARKGYKDLGQQKKVDDVQSVLEVLYTERSSYTKLPQELIGQPAEGPNAADNVK